MEIYDFVYRSPVNRKRNIPITTKTPAKELTEISIYAFRFVVKSIPKQFPTDAHNQIKCSRFEVNLLKCFIAQSYYVAFEKLTRLTTDVCARVKTILSLDLD